ncbi:substrate-binding domain-containing protein [Spongiactinospora sp. 9N601]|uniref:substrate-binding domain-containing protein n=1 Tax=Spongiactinospora sp. 9N601 TaxID=3375149 RepID=UPI0037B79506
MSNVGEVRNGMPRLRRVVTLVAGVVLSLAVAAPAMAAPPSANGKMDEIIRGSGSDTTYEAIANLDEAFNASPGCTLRVPPAVPQIECDPHPQPAANQYENYDHETAVSLYPQGSSAGLRQLCEKGSTGVYPVDYARSSSGPGSVPSQCQNAADPLRYVAFAKDAIAIPRWNGGPSGSVTSLTHDQLREIFLDTAGDGCAENWSDFGGGSGQIIVHGVQTSSGTYATWQSFLGGNPNTCVAATGGQVLFENDCTPINNLAVADRQRSIWWLSFGKYQTGAAACDPAATDLLSVNGVVPQASTIQDGSYQYSRSLYNVYHRTSVPAHAKDYIGENGWICKPNTQHTKPVGSAGLGIAHASANRNWGAHIDTIIADAGFVKVNASPLANKCTFTDVN